MDRIPVNYTFGNHMHWVDMEWLWGYHVLPGSIRDMLRFCRETGAKGCVNFDGVGYEKLAAEDPEALAELKQAIGQGLIEPVGCSYGQPYGLFHGGESNIRQRIYGVRTAMRLLGARPKTFWEEEFDFFPQLPQILKGCGFEYASLFFQWTWHTPEIPKEEVPAIWWEAPDGSKLLAATRNKLNLHQWPEDFDGLLDELAQSPLQEFPPLIQQWLELMPSPDWMCRSEVLLPRMKELVEDGRFEVRFGTLAEYLRGLESNAIPARQYTMDQIWHGMSLGKNGDRMRRLSAEVERTLQEAETLSAILSLFGRPYAQWDVYPTWELEEAWRELLQAQHHDNDECEGLCGRMGLRSYEKARSIAGHVIDMQLESLEKRFTEATVLNLEPWCRRLPRLASGMRCESLVGAPGFGWVPTSTLTIEAPSEGWQAGSGNSAQIRGTGLEAEWSTGDSGAPTLRLRGKLKLPLNELATQVDGKKLACTSVDSFECTNGAVHSTLRPEKWPDSFEAAVSVFSERAPGIEAVDVAIHCHPLNGEPDPGMNAGWQIPFRPEFADKKVIADAPLGAYEVRISGKRLRKYPKGDWMTSPQWFEEIEHPFTSLSFVDFLDEDGSGVLVLHDGSQQWFLDERGARVLLSMVDPWDEDRATSDVEAGFRIIPHGPIEHSDRMKLSREFRSNCQTLREADGKAQSPFLPSSFSALQVKPSNVLVSAFYREIEDFSGKHLEHYAGRGMGYPFVIRLAEFDGRDTEVELIVAGPIEKGYRTNLMGEIEEQLQVEELSRQQLDSKPLSASSNELEPFGIHPQRLRFSMRAHQIATLYLDIVPGRKQPRDLDAKREVWATVHRVDS